MIRAPGRYGPGRFPYRLRLLRRRRTLLDARRHLGGAGAGGPGAANAAGNFYINAKATGADVGQQPFGRARGSGTNDKAGSILNPVRWISRRTIKETFAPPHSFEYPYMTER